MCIIQLDLKHRIIGGERAWELQRPRLSKGKSEWRSYKWFPTLSSAVREAAHAEIRTDPAEGLAEALTAVDRVVRRYENAFDSAVHELGHRAEQKLRASS